MREMLQLSPTGEQREAVEAKIKQLQEWVNGDLDPGPDPILEVMPADSDLKHYEITIEEEVPLKEV